MTLMKFLCSIFSARCACEEPSKRAQEAPPRRETAKTVAPVAAKPIGQTTAVPDPGGRKGRPDRQTLAEQAEIVRHAREP